MRLEFVKAFVEITQDIFVEVLGNGVVPGKLSLESGPRTEGNVVTLIDLSGEVIGKILLHMELSTARAIAKRMTGHEVNSRPMIASCIAELAGMAIGRAISWINDQSCYIQMSPPIVTMEALLAPLSTEVETLVFPVNTACGETVLNISVVDSQLSA
jgi:CheY-specific phosphatase CheX